MLNNKDKLNIVIGLFCVSISLSTNAQTSESICGTTTDWQNVEQYNGTLGVTRDFVNTHQGAVGRLVDNVSCSGTLLPGNRFLTAAHCFEASSASPSVAATSFDVEFNFQVNSLGTTNTIDAFPVIALEEHRNGGLDYAIALLGGNPSQKYPVASLRNEQVNVGEEVTIIQHPRGIPKVIESGFISSNSNGAIFYRDLDTDGGSSGSGVLDENGLLVGVHTRAGCTQSGGANEGVAISEIAKSSTIISQIMASNRVGISRNNNFEEGIAWANSGEFDWLVRSGGTPSGNTGPSSGVGGSGQYAYFETSGGFANRNGDRAYITSPSFEANSTNLSFNYHMYGSDIGSLSVAVLDGGEWNTIWSLSGQQHASNSSAWSSAEVNLSNYDNEIIKVRFEGEAVGGYRGDIAIDNVQLVSELPDTVTSIIRINNGHINHASSISSMRFKVADKNCLLTRFNDYCDIRVTASPGSYKVSFDNVLGGNIDDFEWSRGCDSGNSTRSCTVDLIGGNHTLNFSIEEEDIGAE